MDHAVELLVTCLDALDGGVDQFGRMNLPTRHERSQSGGVVVPEDVAHQCGTRPPLTTIVWPETNAESSESR